MSNSRQMVIFGYIIIKDCPKQCCSKFSPWISITWEALEMQVIWLRPTGSESLGVGPANYLTISPSDFLSLKLFKMVHILRLHGNWVESKVCGFSFFFLWLWLIGQVYFLLTLDNRKWKRILCLLFLVKPSLMIE